MTAKELLSECCHSCHSKNACDHVRTLSYAVIAVIAGRSEAYGHAYGEAQCSCMVISYGLHYPIHLR